MSTPTLPIRYSQIANEPTKWIAYYNEGDTNERREFNPAWVEWQRLRADFYESRLRVAVAALNELRNAIHYSDAPLACDKVHEVLALIGELPKDTHNG